MTLLDIVTRLFTTPVSDLLLWAFLGFGALLMLGVLLRGIAYCVNHPLDIMRAAGHDVGRLIVRLRGLTGYARRV